jgi:hypothetical protein
MLKLTSILGLAVLISLGTVAQTTKRGSRSKKVNRPAATKPADEGLLPDGFGVEPLGVEPPEWLLATSSSDTYYFYNTVKMSRAKSGTIKTWVKLVLKTSLDENSDYPYTLELREYDCDETRSRLLSFIRYGKDGKPSESYELEDKEAKWKHAAPDSVGEAVLETVCKNTRFIKAK